MATLTNTLYLAEPHERPSLLLHHLINLPVAVVWGLLVYFCTWVSWDAQGLSWKTLFLVAVAIRNSSFPILFLCRRPAKVSSTQIKEWVVAFVGTFIGFYYNSAGSYSLFAADSHGIIYIFMTLAMILCTAALLSLGRSFGLVPANRGIKTMGLYALVRHPVYACYIIFDVFLLALMFSGFNLMIFGIFIAATYLRAMYEEGLLCKDLVYREYAKQTPYRFFPGLI